MDHMIHNACVCDKCLRNNRENKQTAQRLRWSAAAQELYKAAGVTPLKEDECNVRISTHEPDREPHLLKTGPAYITVSVGKDWLETSDHPAAVMFRRCEIEEALTT